MKRKHSLFRFYILMSKHFKKVLVTRQRSQYCRKISFASQERRGVKNNFRAYDGTAPALTTARFQNKVSNSCSHTHKYDVIRLCIKRA